jgi:hypothetical protein
VTSTTSPFLCPSCRRKLRPPEIYPLHCRCGHVITSGPDALFSENRGCGISGPGTELKAMLDAIGVQEKADCSCKLVRRKMDEWGVAGCQDPANLAWIVAQMQANAAKYSWFEKVQVAMSAAASPLALVIDPLDIYGSLVREAIRRADAKTR